MNYLMLVVRIGIGFLTIPAIIAACAAVIYSVIGFWIGWHYLAKFSTDPVDYCTGLFGFVAFLIIAVLIIVRIP